MILRNGSVISSARSDITKIMGETSGEARPLTSPDVTRANVRVTSVLHHCGARMTKRFASGAASPDTGSTFGQFGITVVRD